MITRRGQIVGNYSFDNSENQGSGFLLRGGNFTSIDFPGAVLTWITGINPRGEIVGFYDTEGGNHHGFVRSKEAFESIDIPGALYTFANGINPQGDIVGFYADSGGQEHSARRNRRIGFAESAYEQPQPRT
jgi:hypothetical protein